VEVLEMRAAFRSLPGALPVLLALIVAGCGELATPVGDVTGRVVGAMPGAYAYPLERPDLKVDLVIDADGVGTYSIPAVPTSVEAIVLYDGAPPPDGNVATPDGRAELVPVELTGGTLNRVADRFGAVAAVDELQRMPLAGTVLAAAVPAGGATPWQPTFALPATPLDRLVPVSGGTYAVWPLPPGRFDVAAALPGFVPGAGIVDVAPAATTPAPVSLPVDLGATKRGCDAVTASGVPKCENGLVCEPADGRCYECTAADAGNCSKGCNLETYLCNPTPSSVARFCSPCAADGDCGSSGMLCRKVSSTTGYCTTSSTCTSANEINDCPAGFECEDEDDFARDVIRRPYCRPPEGCDAWIQTMGAACYTNSRCDDDLEHGWCQGETSDTPGFCTARCTEQRDCEVGATTNLVCNVGSGYCVKG
jgi:hypothetical protein